MSEKSELEIIKEGLNELLSKEKPNLPYYIEDTFKTCIVMGLLFEGLKLGEISNNVVFQLTRFAQMFDINIDIDKKEIKEIVKHFVEIIQGQLKKIGEKNVDKQEDKSKKGISNNKSKDKQLD